MRATLLFCALATAAFAPGQTTVVSGPEAMVRGAYENQRQNDILAFKMTAQDTQSGVSFLTHAYLYWRLSTDPRTNKASYAQAELDICDVDAKGNDVLRMRLVADGASLYRYDLVRREVSSSTYGFFGPKVPQDYTVESDAPRLLAQLRTATPGLTAYLVRLIDEINPAGTRYANLYTDWLPGRPNQAFDQVPEPIRQGTGLAATVHDPITGTIFTQGSDEWMFSGMDRTNTDRTVAFHMVDANKGADGTTPLWIVDTIDLAQRTATRKIGIRLEQNDTPMPAGIFAPYTGAQATAFRPVASRS